MPHLNSTAINRSISLWAALIAPKPSGLLARLTRLIALLCLIMLLPAPIVSNQAQADAINPALVKEFNRLTHRAVAGSLLATDNFFAVHRGNFDAFASDILRIAEDIDMEVIVPPELSGLLALPLIRLDDNFANLIDSNEPVKIAASMNFLLDLLVNEGRIDGSALGELSGGMTLKINDSNDSELLYFDGGDDLISLVLNSYEQLAIKPNLPKGLIAYESDILQRYSAEIDNEIANLESERGFAPGEWSIVPIPPETGLLIEELFTELYIYGSSGADITPEQFLQCLPSELEALGNDRSRPGFRFECYLEIFESEIGWLNGEIFFTQRSPHHLSLSGQLGQALIELSVNEQGFEFAITTDETDTPLLRMTAVVNSEDQLDFQMIVAYQDYEEIVGSYTLNHTSESLELNTGLIITEIIGFNQPATLVYEMARETRDSPIYEGGYTISVPDLYNFALRSEVRIVDTPDWLWSSMNFSGNVLQSDYANINGQVETKIETRSGSIAYAEGRRALLP